MGPFAHAHPSPPRVRTHTDEEQENFETIEVEKQKDWLTLEIVLPVASYAGMSGFTVSAPASAYQGPGYDSNGIVIAGFPVVSVSASAYDAGLRIGMFIVFANGIPCTPTQLQADATALENATQLVSDSVRYNDMLLEEFNQSDELVLVAVQR